jgi:hypothetical protein
MIWLIGHRGMLGREVLSRLEKKGLAHKVSDMEVDITDINQLKSFIGSRTPDWMVNCSAYTAVDRAEDEASLAFRVNADGVRNLARIAEEKGAKLFHISTDYVFDGNSLMAYTEEDLTNPIGVYAKSKHQGEIYVRQSLPRHFIIRRSWSSTTALRTLQPSGCSIVHGPKPGSFIPITRVSLRRAITASERRPDSTSCPWTRTTKSSRTIWKTLFVILDRYRDIGIVYCEAAYFGIRRRPLAAAGLFAGATASPKRHFLLGPVPPGALGKVRRVQHQHGLRMGGLGLLAVTHPPGYEGLPDPS